MSAAEQAEWRTRAGIPLDAPVVLFAGRLVREKGVRHAGRGLAARGAARRAVLCIVGEGPLRERLERSAPGGVVFAGRLPRDELAVAYAASETLVVPSIATRRFLEPWGLVCNEAMMQSRP